MKLLDRFTIVYLRQTMRDLYYGRNAKKDIKEDEIFEYDHNCIESFLGAFLNEGDDNESYMRDRYKHIVASHEDISMMQIDIIGQGPLWIPKPDYVKEREKPKPFTWNDVTRSTESFWRSNP